MARRGTIERSLGERLRQLESEQIPRLKDAANADEDAAAALLAAAQRERRETLDSLDRARALDHATWDMERIEVGDTVELVEVGRSEAERFVLVWETGSRLCDDWISHRSPVGRALIGRGRGNVIFVDAPGGRVSYRIADFGRSR